jgi:two-component system, NarL family, sensor histidine kinase UhpB
MIAPQTPVDSTDKHLLLLHLEDSKADQRLAQITLRKAGIDCEIICTDNLAEFVSLIQAQQFDVVLADFYLLGFTALDAWNQVRQLPQCPPIVLLSGAIGETAAADAIRQGIADYLLKDDMARLPLVIARTLEVHEARLAKEQAMQELARSESQLAALTEHLHQSIEQERAAIAREIHDDIGGALTSVKFDLSWIDRNSPSPEVRTHARTALEMLEHALGASQRIMMNLRPPVLDQGLVAAVQWLAENFERRTGIATRVDTPAHIAVSSDLQVVAYRTAQEALTNVSKYARATAVHIDIANTEGFLTLEVRDNGQGMAPEQRLQPESFGLRGLAERARTVDGWLDISSQVGKGTSIIVSIPLS